jgi:hypothetical protein
MKTLSSCATLLLIALPFGANAYAAAPLFLGNGFYSIPPNTQLGPSTHWLAINNTSFGVMVAGQFQVSVPAGASGGTLLHYQVKRQLNPNFGSQYMNLQTWLVGFSQPPAGGTYSLTTGYVSSYLEISGQPALIPLSLNNGAATWNVNMAGPYFNYVSGTDMYLVQDFQLDASRLSGPAGTWIVDLPVESRLVPEPRALTALGTGGLALLLRRRSSYGSRLSNVRLS